MFDTFNRLLFDGQLPDCLITLQREKACVAYFSAERFGDLHGRRAHEIAMNPAFFAIVPLVETCATLVHEMVHLWQFVFGKPGRGRYHNEAFAAKMESIGLMPSSTGRPGGRRTGDQMADYPLPGGRFLWACEQLLTAEFTLSWYDRFTPHEPREMADHSAVADTLPAGAAAAAMVIPAHAGVAIQPARDLRRPQQLAAVDADGATAPAAPVYGSSNRIKYICSCAPKPCAVWGKADLRIRCEMCSQLFVDHLAAGQRPLAKRAGKLPAPSPV